MWFRMILNNFQVDYLHQGLKRTIGEVTLAQQLCEG